MIDTGINIQVWDLIVTKMSKRHIGWGEQSLQQKALENWRLIGKIKVKSIVYTLNQNKFNWTKNLRIKPKILNLLKGNTGKYFKIQA